MSKLAVVVLLMAFGCGSSGPGTGSGGASGKGGAGGGAGPGTGGNSATGGSGYAGSPGSSGGSGPGGAGGKPAGSGGAGATDAGGSSTGGVSGGSGGAGPADGGGGSPPPLTGTAFVFAAATEGGGSQLTTFGFDLMTGALTRKGGGTAGGASPDYVAVHPTGKFLFVNNETGSGRATAFSIGADGTLTMLNSTGSGGGGPAHIWAHKSGKWLLQANYNDGRLGIAQIADDGKVTATSSVNAGGQAHMALDDGVQGNFVFVPCKAAGHVAMFKFDVATGQATPNSPATVAVSNAPRHMAFNPNGKFAYVTQESGTALVAFSYDSTSGLLSAPKPFGGLPNDGAHVLVHPSGNFVFHIARGGNAVTVLKVGDDGTLTRASNIGSGGYDGTLTKDGRFLLVVSGSNVKVYSVNATTGALTAAGTGQAVNGSQSVAVTVL